MHLLVRLADALNMGFKFGYMVAQKLHCQPVRCLQRIVPVFHRAQLSRDGGLFAL